MSYSVAAISGAIVALLFGFAGLTDKYDRRCADAHVQIIQGKMYRCVEIKMVEKETK